MPRKRVPKPKPKPTTGDVERVPNDSLEYASGLMLLEGKPFTGVGYDLHDEGWLEREIGYRDGVEWGYKRQWGGPKRLIRESPMLRGAVHGRERTWHDNGTLATEGECEYGIVLWENSWDEGGRPIKKFELKETDAQFTFLLQLRRIYGER